MNPSDLQEMLKRVDWVVNNTGLNVLMVIFLIPLMIRVAFLVAKFIIKWAEGLESTEKPKHEPPISFFEQPDTEPDYVVGFGDDGELLYASEKPKRKNDEVG